MEKDESLLIFPPIETRQLTRDSQKEVHEGVYYAAHLRETKLHVKLGKIYTTGDLIRGLI